MAAAATSAAGAEPRRADAGSADAGSADAGPAAPGPADAGSADAEPADPGLADPGTVAAGSARGATAEQAAADLALLRTFGGGRRDATAEDPETAEAAQAQPGASTDDPPTAAARPLTFRVTHRDGSGVPGASATLLDDRGHATASTVADPDGRGALTARHPGGYVLVTTADGYQPGAATITVADGPLDVAVQLLRSASVAGTVCGEDGPIVGAQVALVQDGEVVGTLASGIGGGYCFADLAGGEYGLSVSAPECEAAALVVRLADEVDLRRDVDLEPAGLPPAAPRAPADDEATDEVTDVVLGGR